MQDFNMEVALHRNKSNCFCVYNRYRDNKTWYSNYLSNEIKANPGRFQRECMVVTANLGVMNAEDIVNKIQEAKYHSGFSHIDIVTVEINSDVAANENGQIASSIMTKLQMACQDGEIQGIGVIIDLAPFNYHKPPMHRGSPFLSFPRNIEEDIVEKFVGVEMVLYEMSPSHAVLPTFTFTPENAICNHLLPIEKRTRRITRIAIHPFTCLRGLGK